ncbi:cobalamin biosynthesis protein [Natrinema saccharevitans]|uniref:Cobalamin biosynthesis protein n=1 Tax=Natrinema saccharevitans TaxID=301967 RepID=A0A1S8AX08_9EURY|nr:cobalamin biosynthesis protein [Natrinema saccharevitans]OLZ41398.1 cobalamin biosynthesis protein [Natrinema saccharevitans]
MSDARSADGGDDALEVSVPSDPLAGHAATAYFWGHVAGSGDVTDDRIEVVANDEASAQVLAAVAGGDLERETTSREYAHDTSITRTEEEYVLTIEGEDGLLGRSGALGLPVDGRGNYRFGAFADYDRELLRGLLEGCGTVCFKSSSGTVGISFVHDDRDLLAFAQELIADCPVDAPFGELSETSSGGHWFGVDDAAAPAFGTWLYEDCEETGLFAPSRRRKLERSLEQADAYDE